MENLTGFAAHVISLNIRRSTI